MKKICCLCNSPLDHEFGNNPSPLEITGECCTICDHQRVLIARRLEAIEIDLGNYSEESLNIMKQHLFDTLKEVDPDQKNELSHYRGEYRYYGNHKDKPKTYLIPF